MMTEWGLRNTALAHDFRYTALRDFSVAGADPEGRTGQSTSEATHLVKVTSDLVTGQRDHINVYGEGYDTPDRTCIRDYIHLSDLAAAHVEVYKHTEQTSDSFDVNCGYGRGYSVREFLDTVGRDAGATLDIRNAPRRAGDPPELAADVSAIQQTIGWQPENNDLGFIVRTALAWELKWAVHDR